MPNNTNMRGTLPREKNIVWIRINYCIQHLTSFFFSFFQIIGLLRGVRGIL
uniref:Uncharacterized protein MANES_14G144700 n=1 Tax=Rhizophora mucronata TaxID=61149 RepID=A0A2P2IYE9_RHIMU